VETRACFRTHDAFGLQPERVCFFKQGMWPALSEAGTIILDRPDHIFMSPDGHGGTLSALRGSGALDDMRNRKLRMLFYFQVDNPLVDVADPVFLGFHAAKGADISVKVCAKRDPEEKLGVVVSQGERFAMVEYTELTTEQKHARLPDGSLRFQYGSVAIHCFSLDFLQEQAEVELPLHLAHKKVPTCDDGGNIVTPAEPNAYKFEKFIFDVIPNAGRAVNLAFDRADEFSPVKNTTGEDSPATVVRDLTAKFARWLESAGVDIPRDGNGQPLAAIEIDPLVAVCPADLIGKLPPGLDCSKPVLLR
jgi:UDP-N-acetylglucosamine/UDP-N-acetylgalactosamine diphosphorylase